MPSLTRCALLPTLVGVFFDLLLGLAPSRSVIAAPAAGKQGDEARGASFDCAKASTRIEKMICADSEVSALDGHLALVYRRALEDGARAEALKVEQRTWLAAQRNKCPDVACLKQAYQKRIEQLAAPQSPDDAPPAGAAPPAAVAAPTKADAVCEVIRKEIARGWPTLRGGGSMPGLEPVEWQASEAARSLPEMLREARESRLDLDNDGAADRVFKLDFDDHYIHGSVLLVQRGPQMKDQWFVPCQLDDKAIPFDDCPPFSQKHDETGFTVPGKAAKRKAVFFRSRYADLTPFRFAGSTYIAVESYSEDTSAYVAVIKPTAGKTFEPTCLLRH